MDREACRVVDVNSLTISDGDRLGDGSLTVRRLTFSQP